MINKHAHQIVNQATIKAVQEKHSSPYAAPGWAGHPFDLHQSRCSGASSEPECRSVSSPSQTVSSPHRYIGTTLFEMTARAYQRVFLLLPGTTCGGAALSM